MSRSIPEHIWPDARPRGTIGAEVWVKVAVPGDPPPSDPTSRLAGPGELRFLLLSTRTPAP